ncbi:MAG: carbamoyl-phosphate synthase large subunit [Solirubrobacteraceae bacterium]|jgi:carbamoyl-phosphate synthase large subunit|nr:carbamoyl-phosphate synthase large subunit [Solirubrobacteraceae bacterium]
MSGATVNVLFTSAGRRVELVRAFRRAYADLELEGEIVAVDMDPLAPALREADRAFIVPRLEDPGYVPALLACCREQRIDLVFPLIDPDVPVLAEQRAELEAVGARAMAVPPDAARITADKQETAELFGRLGVPSPAWWTPQDALSVDLDFPVFVKPRFGSAGEHAYSVADHAELHLRLGSVQKPIVQEQLPGPEVTSDVLCLEDGEVAAVCSRQRIEVRSGEVAKAVTVHDQRIVDRCAQVAGALEARGPITVQCLMRDGEPLFTEVNARFGGGAPLGFAAGMLSPDWLLAHAAGRDVELPPLGSYEVGLHMTRFDESFFINEEERAELARNRL